MRATSCSSLVLLLALLSACGDDGSATPDARQIDAEIPPDAIVLPAGDVDAEVVTFNVGLIQTVKGSEARIPHIVAAVEASGADIVCFQEVYTQYTTPQEIATELEDVYPYAVWDDFTMASVGNGLLIVSKVPLYLPHFRRFEMNDPNEVVDRAVLGATAISGTDWHLHVLCTHLQAGLDATNTAVRRSQLAEIGEFAEEWGYDTGPSVLLGDFNAGPDPDPTDLECPDQGGCPATCTPVDTETIASVESTYGWTDRSDEQAFTLCTYCKAEADALAFLPLFPCEGSQRIDHCFVRGLGNSDVQAMDRVMDDPVSIDIGGGDTAMTLSDHYAVQCSLGPPP
jgi:endonuclease/exonuclease/phosphatase family metal-dependent hydrolase